MKTLLFFAIIALIQASFAFAQDSDDLAAQTGAQIEPLPATEQFIAPPADVRSFTGGQLLLRPDATVPDAQIHLKNICRWSPADAALFDPVGDLTVSRIGKGRLNATVTIDQVRATLSDAGVNIAVISFGGSMSYAVNRPDSNSDQQEGLNDWLSSGRAQAASAIEPPAGTVSASNEVGSLPPSAAAPTSSLRNLLVADLATRLNLDPNDLQVSFDPSDDKVLNLAEPYFAFQITPERAHNLGDVSWSVQVIYEGKKHEADISGSARAWRRQGMLSNPLACRQTIRDEDVVEQRSLVDEMPEEPLLTKAQAVGQAASRDLKPGMVLTASMVNPAMLAQPGQLVTVTVQHRSFRITAVARAIEGGTFGQTIRVRGDTDPTLQYEVTLTGPQEGTVVPGSEKDDSPTA